MEASAADRLQSLSLDDLWAGIEEVSRDLDKERARVGLPVTPDEAESDMAITDKDGKLTPEAEAVVESSPEDKKMDKELAEKLMGEDAGKGDVTAEGGTVEQTEKAAGASDPQVSPDLMAMAEEHLGYDTEVNKRLMTALVGAVGEAEARKVFDKLKELDGPAAKGNAFRDEFASKTGRSSFSAMFPGNY